MIEKFSLSDQGYYQATISEDFITQHFIYELLLEKIKGMKLVKLINGDVAFSPLAIREA